MGHPTASSGDHSVRSGPGKTYRGSRRRVRRIGLRGNWSVELWIVVAVVLFALLVIVPWMVRHPPPDRHEHAGKSLKR